MPKTNLCKPRVDPREAEVRAMISAGIKRSGANRTWLEKRVCIKRSTLTRRLSDPREMRLGELWDIMDALHVSEEDRRKIV